MRCPDDSPTCPDGTLVAAQKGTGLMARMQTPTSPLPISTTPSGRPAPARRLGREAFDLAGAVVVALAMVAVLHTVLFQPFTIPSSSMEPGLVTGDYIVVSKFAYGWSGASLPFDLPLDTQGSASPRARRRGLRLVTK